MTSNADSEYFYPCSEEFIVPHHGFKTRTDSGFGEAEHHSANTWQTFSDSCEDNTERPKSFENAVLVRDAFNTMLLNGCGSRHSLQRRDSVTASSGSSNKRRRKDGSSRRLSTQSARPSTTRTTSMRSPSSRQEDPLACYQRSVALFPKSGRTLSTSNVRTETFLAPCSPGFERPKINAISASGSVSSAPKTPSNSFIDATPNSIDETKEEHESVPATVIHWTSPETRQQEYDEIKRSYSGVPGLWRKVAPAWLCPLAPAPFYDETRQSDAGSVRRHRLDLPVEEDEPETMTRPEPKKRPSILRSLSCF